MSQNQQKHFLYNFWLQSQIIPDLPQSQGGTIFVKDDEQMIVINFDQGYPLLYIINHQTFEIEDLIKIDTIECPIINYDFLHKDGILLNDRIYLVANQNPRESSHIFVIDIKEKQIFPIKNIDTKPQEQRFNGSISLYNYKLMFFGGFNENMQPLNSLEAFDLTTYRWEKINTKGRVPMPRHSHTTIIHNNRMVVMGGTESNDLWNKNKQFRDIFVLDLINLIWVQVKTDNMLLPNIMNLAYIQPVYIDSQNIANKIFLYLTQNSQNNEFQVFVFNPLKYTFVELDVYSQKPSFRYNSAIGFDQINNKMVIYGGFQFNVPSEQSLSNEIFTFQMFKEEQSFFKDLNLYGGIKVLNNMQDIQQLAEDDDELYEESNQKLKEITFEELLAIEKENIQFYQNYDQQFVNQQQQQLFNQQQYDNYQEDEQDDDNNNDDEEDEDQYEDEEFQEDNDQQNQYYEDIDNRIVNDHGNNFFNQQNQDQKNQIIHQLNQIQEQQQLQQQIQNINQNLQNEQLYQQLQQQKQQNQNDLNQQQQEQEQLQQKLNLEKQDDQSNNQHQSEESEDEDLENLDEWDRMKVISQKQKKKELLSNNNNQKNKKNKENDDDSNDDQEQEDLSSEENYNDTGNNIFSQLSNIKKTEQQLYEADNKKKQKKEKNPNQQINNSKGNQKDIQQEDNQQIEKENKIINESQENNNNSNSNINNKKSKGKKKKGNNK